MKPQKSKKTVSEYCQFCGLLKTELMRHLSCAYIMLYDKANELDIKDISFKP